MKKFNLIQTVIFLCTVNNIFHGAVFYHLSFHGHEPTSFWEFFASLEAFQSFFVMFVVDLALIALIAFGNTEKDAQVASVLAWCLFVINIFFAGVVEDVMNIAQTLADAKKLTALVGKTLFSALFSYIIHYFSLLNLRLKIENTERNLIEEEVASLLQDIRNLEQKYSTNRASVSKLQADVEQFLASLSTLEASEQKAKAFENQLVALQKEKAKDEIERTIYFPEKSILDSARAVNAKVGYLTDLQKQQHFDEKRKNLAEIEKKYIVS